MPTVQKEKIVAQATQRLEQCSACYLLSFSGLKVSELDDLRGKVLAAGAELQVVKNRLLRLALGPELSEALSAYLQGPTMLAYCDRDPLAPAKALAEFAAEHPGLALKAGVVERRPMGGEQVQQLAKLPPREQILAETLAGIASPVSGLVGVLTAVISELVYVLQAAEDKQQESEAAAAS